MKIEHALSLCGPKSASSMFTCREASPTYVYRPQSGNRPISQARKGSVSSAGARDSYSDILLALGVVQSREALGLSLIFAKYNKDPDERNKAIAGIARFGLKQAPARVGKAAGRQMANCIVLMAKMAVEEYSRTADDPQNRCRCKGRGKVTDLAASRAAGETIEKVCPRCGGSGMKPVKSVSVYKVIKTLVPDLTQRTWSRNWKVFYDSLIAQCYQESTAAERLFSLITSSQQ
ncbi:MULTISPECIES: antitermination protein [unclassified Brenneria]|uniref:antitermination protein n=1 Tax=unclassified Brenneria TaxID=2634434 RepID=UPI0015559E09|nr:MULTISPECIES: antitermination protein [unclassified Brenneria]MBJ7222332.1 antitermination protein [Brenneria sp. L3-3C-1]MEE3643575.1 antitermination protein [Brenneria sp. L3_3C_1]MEE3651285.1 antitermination protein [Brenneria sp. HEZEL_4_2_4]NPD01240.1 antitermination protein [Brenneria sp. hezel4-2-4]